MSSRPQHKKYTSCGLEINANINKPKYIQNATYLINGHFRNHGIMYKIIFSSDIKNVVMNYFKYCMFFGRKRFLEIESLIIDLACKSSLMSL